jgi:pyruvate/2-oxoglutarate dehydrogenase complex dihydrolipoamide dehydrogenase (E3) component
MSSNGSRIEEYDIVVLGAGAAGKFISWTFAKEGMKVACIEKKYVGGSCPNIACLPSKNVIHSAKVASFFQRSEEFGITKDKYSINMSAVRDRKRKMVDGLVQMHMDKFNASGTELVCGVGRFVEPKTIEVTLNDGGTRVLRGKKVVISTGSRAKIDNTPGLRESKPLTHIEALELDVVPRRLIIIGGGYVGLEFAQAMRRFGSDVTIIDRNARLAHREDEDVSEALQEVFQKEGIKVLTNTRIVRVEGTSGESVKLIASRDGSEVPLEGTHILVATGRTPNTDNMGLETAGIKATEQGHVKVNERLETTAADVWALGDCAGSPYFTHIAENDFLIVRDNIMGKPRVTTGRQVPFCMFTDPELARVGLSQTEARSRGIAYKLLKIPMSSVLRTRTLSETTGFMKALIDAKSNHILGFTCFGEFGGEFLAPIQIAMMAGLPYTFFQDVILTHPTMMEGLFPLFTSEPTSPQPAATGKVRETSANR